MSGTGVNEVSIPTGLSYGLPSQSADVIRLSALELYHKFYDAAPTSAANWDEVNDYAQFIMAGKLPEFEEASD